MTKQSKALRAACEKLRRSPMPLADMIPLMQQAADKIDDLEAELRRLDAIEAAARNLVQVKGRYHTEQAYKALQDALGEKK